MADSKPEVAEQTSPITAELADHIEAQRKEYGMYVAARQIHVGTALAYNPGDAVPISNAERLGYVEEGLVVKVGTKEHRDLLQSLGR
mgnify:CR=1 FL=1